MSRQIDWEKPLSEEDRVWAQQFSAFQPLVQQSDASQPLGGVQDPDGDNYEELTVADLEAEARRRNAEEGGQIPTGKAIKAEWVARLREDDAADV